jgi:DNA-binding transcriptional MerR regulator
MTEVESTYRIGEVAERFGVSTRTLRYYEEVGLIVPSGKSPGGSRRYSDADITRIERVLELRNVMGFELDRIADIVGAENRFEDLRDEYHRSDSLERHVEIVVELMSINDDLRAHVAEKLAVLEAFAHDLDARAERLRAVQAELTSTPAT